jgi:AcrR family transcriptional regulator
VGARTTDDAPGRAPGDALAGVRAEGAAAEVAADERPGGRERILTAAREILDAYGEAALKFAAIADRAEVALSVITHHFGTREGLLSVLHAQRFAGLTTPDVAAARQLAKDVGDREQLAAGMAAITDAMVDAGRASVRLARVMSIGATHGRPALEEEVRRTATQLLDELEIAVITAQAKGLIDRRVDARAYATFIQAYALGMIVADLDETPADREAVARLIDRLNFTLLTDPED